VLVGCALAGGRGLVADERRAVNLKASALRPASTMARPLVARVIIVAQTKRLGSKGLGRRAVMVEIAAIIGIP
jgi:hypothetical protein